MTSVARVREAIRARRKADLDADLYWRYRAVMETQEKINDLHRRCGVATVEMDGTRRPVHLWDLRDHRRCWVLPTTDGRILCDNGATHVFMLTMDRDVVECVNCGGFADLSLEAA